jgi:hypothetical protein
MDVGKVCRQVCPGWMYIQVLALIPFMLIVLFVNS